MCQCLCEKNSGRNKLWTVLSDKILRYHRNWRNVSFVTQTRVVSPWNVYLFWIWIFSMCSGRLCIWLSSFFHKVFLNSFFIECVSITESFRLQIVSIVASEVWKCRCKKCEREIVSNYFYFSNFNFLSSAMWNVKRVVSCREQITSAACSLPCNCKCQCNISNKIQHVCLSIENNSKIIISNRYSFSF